MSYDIFCYRSKLGKPDQDEAEEVINADIEKWVQKDYNADIKLALVKALTAYNPDLKAFDFQLGDITKLSVETIENNRNKFDHIELNPDTSDIAVRLTIYSNHVFITVPYWYTGDKASQLFTDIFNYIKLIRDTAGYHVYDPQTAQVFDPDEISFDGLAKYLSVK